MATTATRPFATHFQHQMLRAVGIEGRPRTDVGQFPQLGNRVAALGNRGRTCGVGDGDGDTAGAGRRHHSVPSAVGRTTGRSRAGDVGNCLVRSSRAAMYSSIDGSSVSCPLLHGRMGHRDRLAELVRRAGIPPTSALPSPAGGFITMVAPASVPAPVTLQNSGPCQSATVPCCVPLSPMRLQATLRFVRPVTIHRARYGSRCTDMLDRSRHGRKDPP